MTGYGSGCVPGQAGLPGLLHVRSLYAKRSVRAVLKRQNGGLRVTDEPGALGRKSFVRANDGTTQ